MKIRTLLRLRPFSRDLRNDEQRRQYNTIEQQRADAYLTMYLARRRAAAILRGQINTPYLARRQAE